MAAQPVIVEAVAFPGTLVRCSVCGEPMTARRGWAIEHPSQLQILWWVCEGNPEHRSCVLPLPEDHAL